MAALTAHHIPSTYLALLLDPESGQPLGCGPWQGVGQDSCFQEQ